MELALWGFARAESPDRTKSIHSTVIHVLSLICSLLMVSSLVRDPAVNSGEVRLLECLSYSGPSAGRPS